MAEVTERWQAVEAMFERALELPPAQREARVREWCGSDTELHRLVATLLDADAASGDFIGAAIAGAAALTDHPSRVGEVVGAYRLVGELGQGGMGAVYLAERSDDAYRAQVAIKFLRSTLAAPELARRFRAERQILADLEHPNIARLLDGGTAPDGSPFLVMEYVDGVPLDAWCERERWGIRGRVALMRRVCDAVQHAHRSLVVHRDLKPSNILVTGDGTPKLVDFGIATLVSTERDDGTAQTAYGAMTPGYASPEQLRGARVTTASDTYSLGVVLYRLLTGFPPHELEGLSPAEVERRVTGEPPPLPSSRVRGDAARRLRGDLDTIVLKALRVEPGERYLSAADLSEDLRRWLENEPIAARRAHLGHRLRALARRHPVGVTMSTLAILALATTTAASVVQARRAAAALVTAEERQRASEQATNFLVDLFELADPNTSTGAAMTARTLLDRGAERVLRGAVSDAQVRVSLATSLATIYRNLADYDAAKPLIDTALAVQLRTHGAETPEYASALHEHAEWLHNAGDYDSAAAVHRRVLSIQAARAPGDGEVTEASLYGLGVTLDELGQYEEAEQRLRDALVMNRRLRGDTGISLSQGLLALAAVLRRQARYDAAIPLLEESLQLATASVGRRNLDVAQSLNHLARTMSQAGRSADAVPLVEESIAIQRAIHGKPHPETAASLGNLSGILGDLGRFDEAEGARRESLAMMRAVFGREHPYIAATLTSLGDLMTRKEDWPAAERAYRESLDMHRRTLAADNPNLGYPLTGLGRTLTAQDRAREAESYLREAYNVRAGGMPRGHWHVAASAVALGECLLALSRARDALPFLQEGLAVLDSTFGVTDPRAQRARRGAAQALRALDRIADAEALERPLARADSAAR